MPSRHNTNLDFASIIEESLNEIFIFDPDSLKFILVNRGARENIGYSMDELSGMTPVDLKPFYTEEKFKQTLSPLIQETQDKIQFQTQHRRKDGTEYLAEVHLQKRQFNQQTFFVAIILDVTERAKTSEDLQFAESLLESAPDAMVVVDKTGRVRIANRQMETLLGYSHEELLSMNVDDFVPTAFRSKHAQHRHDYETRPRVRGMGADLDLSAMTKDGSLIPIEVSLSPIESETGHLVAAAIRDITDRKKVEHALKDSEEKQRQAREIAEHATNTKSRFLAAASHDLRQPLQALRLYLSALTMRVDDEKALQLGEKMHLSLDTMGELLEALLDISSLESGNIEAEIQQVNLRDITDRVVVASAPQAQKKELLFEVDIDDIVVRTDPALTERILENYISNAIRYTPKGSIKLYSSLSDNAIKISVADSGIGIPQEALETVFDEYYQLDNDVRDRSKGLGLGLSIVKHLARILNHPISAESNEGEGSTFSVEIPLGASQHEDSLQNQFAINLTPGPANVLIIDDDVTIVDAMAEVLRTFDIEVALANSGVQALELIEQGLVPTLVISDYRMPTLNGLETVSLIRQKLDREVPVVMMTGDTSADLIKEVSLKNFDVLNKPVPDKTLLQLVELLTNAAAT